MTSPGAVRLQSLKDAVDGLVGMLPKLTAEPTVDMPTNQERSEILVPILKNAGFDVSMVCFDSTESRNFLQEIYWRPSAPEVPYYGNYAYYGTGRLNPVASDWLDPLLRVLASSRTPDLSPEKILHRIRATRDHPLQINQDGESVIFLRPENFQGDAISVDLDPGSYTAWSGSSELDSRDTLGRHTYCNGRVSYVRVTEKLGAIACPGCQLRVLVPYEIRTYGQLREYFFEQFPLQKIEFS